MTWTETIIECLKDADISLIAYVPDISIHQVTRLMEADDYFHVVSATREEEAIGIATGAYAVGRNAAVFMQSSGFGNTVNAIASLCIPARVPIPMFINLRGEVGEFNIAQVVMGRATRPDSGHAWHPALHTRHGRQARYARFRRAQTVLLVTAASGPVSHSDAARGQTCIGFRPPSASCPT